MEQSILSIVGASKMKEEFELGTQSYVYFHHPHNTTWANERTVEIPVAWTELCRRLDGTILEIGNVMGNYFNFAHTVIDKYESGPGITTCDLFEYKPDKQFDFVISVSTIEHVGCYKTESNPELAVRAMSHLRSFIKPDGAAFISIPLGQNKPLTKAIVDDGCEYKWRRCMRRTSAANTWEQCNLGDIATIDYGTPYPCGNGVVFYWL